MRLAGIEPTPSAWEANIVTIQLKAHLGPG